MAAIESKIARRWELSEENSAKAAKTLRAPILAVAVLLVPMYVTILVALIAGVFRARFQYKSEILRIPPRIDSAYSARPLGNNKFLDQICLGVGMEFTSYKAGLNQRARERGALTAEQRKEYFYDLLPELTPVMLEDDRASRHVMYVGQTGVGKTEAMLSALKQNIDRGGGGIIFLMKGEEDAAARVFELCKAANRENSFRFINFEDTSLSHSYSPFVGRNIRALTSTATKLQKEGGEPFFEAVSYSGLSAAIIVLTRQKNRSPFNFRDLYTLFTDHKEFIRLYELMAEDTDEERMDKAFIGHFLQGFVSYNRDGDEYFAADKWQTFYMGVISAIGPFTTSTYGPVMNSYDPDIELTRSIENNEVIVVSISSLADTKGAALFGQLFLADFGRAIGEVQKKGTKPMIPFFAWLDEYASLKHEHHQALFQLARSGNISLNISIQGINFLKDLSQEFAMNLASQCWTTVIYDIKDTDTREYAAKIAGMVIREYRTESTSQSSSSSHDSTEGGLYHNRSDSKGVSKGSKEMSEELLQPDDFMLEVGDALIIGKSETYRVRMPIVEFENPQPLDLKRERLVKIDRGHAKGHNLFTKSGRKSFERLL